MKRFASALLTLLLAGLAGASLVRFAPGFGVDERELDTRLSAQSIAGIRSAKAASEGLLPFYAHFLWNTARGELGVSTSLQRPVKELLAERIQLTAAVVGCGLAGGWLFGMGLAVPRRAHWAGSGLSALLFCLPASTLALCLLYVNRSGPVWSSAIAIGLVVFPRVYSFAKGVLAPRESAHHVVMARARGVGASRILFRHVLAPAAPALRAVFGVSVSLALGASIPIETVCDAPGLGQLTWQAAMQRDLPLLVSITLLMTVVTVVANGGGTR